MNEETRKTYTIRLPERIASRLEKDATEAATTPTTLIQSLIIRSLESGPDSATNPPPPKTPERQSQAPTRADRDAELRQEERHRQMLYEIGKMRSVLLHSLDHTLSADTVDDIIEASENAASEYVADLCGSKGDQP